MERPMHWQTRLVGLIDEKLSWWLHLFKRWYCLHYYRLRCANIGENLQLRQPIRKPVINGYGRIQIGDNVTIYGQVEFTVSTTLFEDAEVSIGNNTVIGDHVMFSAHKSIKIGQDCLIAKYAQIYDNDGHPLDPRIRRYGQMSRSDIDRIVVGSNVWIGQFAHIRKGVTIGDNSVVAAHSVVTRDVPPNTVVIGIPARVCGWLDKMFPNKVNAEERDGGDHES